MDERTMYELLEVNDAIDELHVVQEMLAGVDMGCGFGEGILGNLSYVETIIARNSPLYHPYDDEAGERYLEILDDKEMDNHRKARILLGLAE